MKKRILALACVLCLLLTSFVGCNNTSGGSETNNTEDSGEDTSGASFALETPAPVAEAKPDITEQTDYVTQQWVMVEIPFTATATVKKFDEASIDVTFKNRETGTTLVMPGFWDGDTDWKVRFAPTEYGIWDYSVAETGTALGIGGKTGTVAANSYKGDLEIYKRGFVKTQDSLRYFVYNDGTPFFYMGDTHWTMLTEEFNASGDHSGTIKTDSHFKYIVDKRVEQKFTVYQSEPIGATFDVSDGTITKSDVKGFQTCDKYFAYIAEKGLVHANAELLFPSYMTDKLYNNIENLTRYWVARYGAYPVLWTLGQEVDDGTNYKPENLKSATVAQAYIKMCEAINKVDPYKHPTTAHQLNASSVNAAGGVAVAGVDGGYNDYNPGNTKKSGTTRVSAFLTATGHTWWGVQWRPTVDQQYNFDIPSNYWNRGLNKVAVNYESRYENLYTKNFGAIAEGWISYLCGMYGYGYGAQDMWYYKTTYASDSPGNDGVDKVSVQDKKITWSELIEGDSSKQMTYMYDFFVSLNWWKLVPDFNNGAAFVKSESKEGYYCAAYDSNTCYVVYLYNKTTGSAGSLVNMDKNGTYTAQWYNPRTNEYTLIANDLVSADGTYDIPEKPVASDLVLLVTKN